MTSRLLLCTTILCSVALGQSSSQFSHFFAGYVFEVYEDDSLSSKLVSMTIDFQAEPGESIAGHCYIVFVLKNESTQSISLEAHTASTSDKTLEVVSLDRNRVVFDASVSRLLSDRQIRISCEKINNQGQYKVLATGLWPNVFSPTSTKIEWKQRESIVLPYCRMSQLQLH